MKVTAITKFKHGGLYAAIKKLGWTQRELSERSGISHYRIGDIINLQVRPTVENANAIQRALGEAGVYLDMLAEWPEVFAGVGKGFKVERTEDVDVIRLSGCREAMLIEAPQFEDTREIDSALDAALSSLSGREQMVIRSRFWDGDTIERASERVGVSRERIRQIEAKALRKLRHPERRNRVKEAYQPANL